MNLAFLNIGGSEMMLIFIVILVLFGGKKLPELARGLGRGIREFNDASDGIKREIADQINNFEKDLDVDPKAEVKPATESARPKTNVADEINQYGQNQKANDANEGYGKEEGGKKTPTFGPPPGTYEHNPNATDQDVDNNHYKYGYNDHFDVQNDVEYTSGPDSDESKSHRASDSGESKGSNV